MDPIEDHPINLPTEDEQPLPPMPDVPSVDVDRSSVVSIPVDQGLIKSNEAFHAVKPRTNMIDPIEDHPINVTTDDEETLPPMPDMPLVHADPPSVVSIPVDQGFLSRYSPNDVVLAKRFNSYFWPAQISEVHSDKMYVKFFPLSEEMEKEEVSSEEDVKAFTKEERDTTAASLCPVITIKRILNDLKVIIQLFKKSVDEFSATRYAGFRVEVDSRASVSSRAVEIRGSENGLLSFENPNYHLDPARLDDALNSNESSSGSSSLYDELYRELCGVHRNSGVGGDQSGGSARGVQARRAYASLDIGGMGVDVTQGPIIVKDDPASLDAADNSENHNLGLNEWRKNVPSKVSGILMNNYQFPSHSTTVKSEARRRRAYGFPSLRLLASCCTHYTRLLYSISCCYSATYIKYILELKYYDINRTLDVRAVARHRKTVHTRLSILRRRSHCRRISYATCTARATPTYTAYSIHASADVCAPTTTTPTRIVMEGGRVYSAELARNKPIRRLSRDVKLLLGSRSLLFTRAFARARTDGIFHYLPETKGIREVSAYIRIPCTTHVRHEAV
ncbi:unnamed protein product [Trichogramma brassicae]|uniref:PWWP domain-containing protein n=1 Tax=Trichogramma brassicae TaxID=86971 RepID=A0A6H5I5Z2_9HYME|nr:unnamed protein product [Trichogramma brassicae]